MIIVLLGYMASGKTTVANVLGELRKVPVIDLDTFIEEREAQTVSEIFASKGEVYFRKKEHEYLKEILQNYSEGILSLGGGTPCYASNMEFIHKNTLQTFYLQTSIKEIVNRVATEKEKRPLIKDIKEEDLEEFTAKHLFERNAFYQQAKYTIETDEKSAEAIAKEIDELLN